MADELGLVDALAQLSFVVQGTLARHAGDHQTSLTQARLLGILRDREPTMQELARHLGLDKSSTTGLVDRAEARGLVRRMPSTEDRRSVRVRLTPAGRKLASKVGASFAVDVDALTADLTAAERLTLSKLASRVVTHHQATRSGP